MPGPIVNNPETCYTKYEPASAPVTKNGGNDQLQGDGKVSTQSPDAACGKGTPTD